MDTEIQYEMKVLEFLVRFGEIEKGSPAEGIARKAINEGVDSVNSNQRLVYDNYVAEKLAPERKLCHETIARAKSSVPT